MATAVVALAGCAKPSAVERVMSPDSTMIAEVVSHELDGIYHLYLEKVGADDRKRVLTVRRSGPIRATWRSRRAIEVGFEDTADLTCPNTRVTFWGRNGGVVQILLRPYGPTVEGR